MTRLDTLRAHWRQTLDGRDIDLLLADHLGKSPAWIFAHGDHEVDVHSIEPVLRRRASGEPLQYIRGRADFFGREYRVDSRVLIPRPETELLVEAALARAPRGARVVDIGTGSGCIAVSLDRERPDLHVFAVDRSPAALAVAKANNDRLQGNVRFAASDLLGSVSASFDLIVSNPPYIPAADVETLDAVVRDHEPRMALTPGPRGTEIIERILEQAGRARVLLEIGYGQERDLRELAAAKRFNVEVVIPDLAAIPRVVVLSAHGD
jgi:release factor glutamine methyltransferase